jgi:hypothetical protein
MVAVGELIGTPTGIIPAAQLAGTVNGPAIARPGSMTVVALTGAVTGSPSSFTVSMKVQESDDGTAGWTDVAGGALSVITAINERAELNLGPAPKAFIRVVSVVAFVAGTAPAIQVAAIVVTGGHRVFPI